VWNAVVILRELQERDYSGAECLRLAKEHAVDVILLEMMPDMDGFAVCRALKENPRTRRHSDHHAYRAR
jgi:CheY-like chemotaxis protein